MVPVDVVMSSWFLSNETDPDISVWLLNHQLGQLHKRSTSFMHSMCIFWGLKRWSKQLMMTIATQLQVEVEICWGKSTGQEDLRVSEDIRENSFTPYQNTNSVNSPSLQSLRWWVRVRRVRAENHWALTALGIGQHNVVSICRICLVRSGLGAALLASLRQLFLSLDSLPENFEVQLNFNHEMIISFSCDVHRIVAITMHDPIWDLGFWSFLCAVTLFSKPSSEENQ